MPFIMGFLRKLFGINEEERRISVPFPVDSRKLAFGMGPRDIAPVSLWCDEGSYSRVIRAYDNLLVGEGLEQVTYLNKIARDVSAKYWQEVFPFISSLYWAICWRSLSHDESASIPFIGQEFFFQSDLGLIATKSGDVIFLRIQPTRRCEILPPCSSINAPFDLNYAERQMRRHGWKRGTLLPTNLKIREME
jgi:hypothetical protein